MAITYSYNRGYHVYLTKQPAFVAEEECYTPRPAVEPTNDRDNYFPILELGNMGDFLAATTEVSDLDGIDLQLDTARTNYIVDLGSLNFDFSLLVSRLF